MRENRTSGLMRGEDRRSRRPPLLDRTRRDLAARPDFRHERLNACGLSIEHDYEHEHEQEQE